MLAKNNQPAAAFRSVRKYLERELYSLVSSAMVDGARRIAEAEGREALAFQAGLSRYTESLIGLMTDAIGRYQKIVLDDRRLLRGRDPDQLIKSAVTRTVIRPGSRLAWAWVYWAVRSPAPLCNTIPIAPDRLVGRSFQLPYWLIPENQNGGPSIAAVLVTPQSVVRSATSQIRGALQLELDHELVRVRMEISSERHRRASTPKLKNRLRKDALQSANGRGTPKTDSSIRDLVEQLRRESVVVHELAISASGQPGKPLPVPKATDRIKTFAGELWASALEKRRPGTTKIPHQAVVDIGKKMDAEFTINDLPKSRLLLNVIRELNSKNSSRPELQIRSFEAVAAATKSNLPQRKTNRPARLFRQFLSDCHTKRLEP